MPSYFFGAHMSTGIHSRLNGWSLLSCHLLSKKTISPPVTLMQLAIGHHFAALKDR